MERSSKKLKQTLTDEMEQHISSRFVPILAKLPENVERRKRPIADYTENLSSSYPYQENPEYSGNCSSPAGPRKTVKMMLSMQKRIDPQTVCTTSTGAITVPPKNIKPNSGILHFVPLNFLNTVVSPVQVQTPLMLPMQIPVIVRKDPQVGALEQVFHGLKSRLCKTSCELLTNSFGDVIHNLSSNPNTGPSNDEYLEEVVKFASTLNFHSSKAYDYLRRYLRLPDPRALRNWASHAGGKPGFTEEAFQFITEEARNGQLLVCLSVAEIGIQKEVSYDGKETLGHCDFGHGVIDSDSNDFATSALVFTVTAMNRPWNVPIGYCLIDDLTSSVRANVVQEYILMLSQVNAQCMAVTCDSSQSNLRMLQELGANLNPPLLKNWFCHPSLPYEKVYIMLDATHLLKHLQNFLAERKLIFVTSDTDDPDCQEMIRWDLFLKLKKLQRKAFLRNKSRHVNVEWSYHRSKVKQTDHLFRRPVADSLLFCASHGIEGFEKVGATVTFIRHVNNIFDLLNSCHPFAKGYTAPIGNASRNSWVKRFEIGIAYIRDLKDASGKRFIESKKKFPFLGFILSLTAARDLAQTFVWERPALRFLLTKKLSREHLLFSNAFNHDPTASQFQRAYAQSLHIRLSPYRFDLDELKPLILNLATMMSNSEGHDDGRFVHSFDPAYIPEYEPLTALAENVHEYIAGTVVRTISKELKCGQCFDAIIRTNKSSTIQCPYLTQNVCGLAGIRATPEVVALLICAEKVLHVFFPSPSCNSNYVLLKLQLETVSRFSLTNHLKSNNHLFSAVQFGEEPHYSTLLKCLLKVYFSIRLSHMCKF